MSAGVLRIANKNGHLLGEFSIENAAIIAPEKTMLLYLKMAIYYCNSR